MTITHAIVKRRDYDYSHVYNWVELFVSMYNNTILVKNNPVQIKGGGGIFLN